MKELNERDLMTERERAVIDKRCAIARALDLGMTYHQIEETLETSTSTIALVARLTKGERKWK